MSTSDKPRRPLYPYTHIGRARMMPYKFLWRTNWMFRHMIVTSFLLLPMFFQIGRLSKSEGNYAKLYKIRERDAEEWKHKQSQWYDV